MDGRSIDLMDYFLGDDFSFIRFHNFFEEPFRLPRFVTYRVFTLEACHQETIVGNIHGTEINKTKIYSLPLSIANSQVTLTK